MTTIDGASFLHPCLVAQIIDKPRIQAFGMDSGLARGSTPWTPGGYIPVANMLFNPVPIPLFIPVSNMLFIPVPNMLFIPVSNPLFIPVSNPLLSQSAIYFLSQSATHPFTFQHVYTYYLAVLPALINFNSIPTHSKTESIITLLQTINTNYSNCHPTQSRT